MTDFRSYVATEWHGEGFTKGGISELVWGTASIAMGVSVLLFPEAAWRQPALQMLLYKLPLWVLAAPLVASGACSWIGLGLFARHGRCLGSRLTRFAGAALGLATWMTLVLVDVSIFGPRLVVEYQHVGLCVIYARATQLAWRRF